MKSSRSKRVTEKSEINYDYKTIRITKSRIDKGLLAIPKSFGKLLPGSNQRIELYLDESDVPQAKTFSSFDSSTNENRIGGLKNWFADNGIREGDELVLQVLDRERFVYRLLREDVFLNMTKMHQQDLDGAADDEIAAGTIELISNLTQVETASIMRSEFLRLAEYTNEEVRRRLRTSGRFSREKTPASIRTLLGNIYRGHCQICSFAFLKRDNDPYYEIHHLGATLGHHPKNLVLVCANCHRQFEFANVERFFDERGWLAKVRFNQSEYLVKQVIDEIKKHQFLKTTYL